MTVISELLFKSIASLSLEAQNKTIIGAINLPLNIMGETVVTIQLGGTRTPHKVYGAGTWPGYSGWGGLFQGSQMCS